MTLLDEALTACEDWVDAYRDNPDKIGNVYPPSPPISYEHLACLVEAAWAKKMEG